MIEDTFDGQESSDTLKQSLRSADYVDGRGYSDSGKKVEALLDHLTGHDIRPEADDSWGHLTPEAQASDENQWNQMLLEGKL